ncbi:MAG: hypothetical protein ABSB15_21635 [Bryobacteraceae bacterium]|jgi:hypothetical protein
MLVDLFAWFPLAYALAFPVGSVVSYDQDRNGRSHETRACTVGGFNGNQSSCDLYIATSVPFRKNFPISGNCIGDTEYLEAPCGVRAIVPAIFWVFPAIQPEFIDGRDAVDQDWRHGPQLQLIHSQFVIDHARNYERSVHCRIIHRATGFEDFLKGILRRKEGANLNEPCASCIVPELPAVPNSLNNIYRFGIDNTGNGNVEISNGKYFADWLRPYNRIAARNSLLRIGGNRDLIFRPNTNDSGGAKGNGKACQEPRYIRRNDKGSLSFFITKKGETIDVIEDADLDVSCDGKMWFHVFGDYCLKGAKPFYVSTRP